MLDIIVPHYKEPWELGKKLFDMIALQRGIDFDDIHVTLVNDGEENALPEEYFAAYPFPFRQISIPHAGVSAARNAGLKLATEKWVMFCDFDDTFTNIYAIHGIFDGLKKAGDDFDLLWCELYMEDNRTGVMEYHRCKEINCVFTHAKLFLRKFLADNKIAFNEELSFNEDSEFVSRVMAMAETKRTAKMTLPVPPYAWIFRYGSTTNTPGRKSEAAIGHWGRNKSVCATYRHVLPEYRYNAMVARTVWDAYNALNIDNPDHLMQQYLEEFCQWYGEHREAYKNADVKDLPQIIQISKTERTFPDRFRAKVSIDQWLESIGLTP